MTLHDEIMNIPCEPIEGTESEVLAFKLGHKQALHAAAELVERFSEWKNEAAAALARFVSLSSHPDEMQWLEVASEVPYLLSRKDERLLYSIDSDEEPASLSKAMSFLESKEVQMRREQKLRDEIAALKNDLGLACALLDQATACSGIGPDKALDWWAEKGRLVDDHLSGYRLTDSHIHEGD